MPDKATIRLSQRARKLRSEVEKLYGRPVQFLWLKGGAAETHAYSDVAPDGTPRVAFNPNLPLNESNAVHELFHLKLRGEGFPIPSFEPGTVPFSERDKAYLLFILAYVWDSITHYVFFPAMRTWGVDPETVLASGIEYVTNRPELIRVKGVPPEDVKVVTYFAVWANVMREDVRERLTRWFVRYGHRSALARGKELVAVLERTRPASGAAAVAALDGCLSLLGAHGRAFRFVGWEYAMYGLHRQLVARFNFHLRP